MRPLGELVDRLSIINIKLWHVQDWVHESAEVPLGEFEAQGCENIQAQLQKLKSLNLERTRLMNEIDEAFARGVETGKPVVEARIKIL
jgi:hypothetical protein